MPGFLKRDEVHRRIGKHPRRHPVPRLAVDLRRRSELRHPALPERGGVAAQKQRLLRFGRGIDEDRARGFEDPRNLHPQLLAQLVVEIGQRFVQQHQPRVLHQRPRQRAALLLPARQLQRFPVQHRRQLHQLRRLAHTGIDLGPADLHQPQGGGDVVIDRHRRIIDELLIDHGDAPVLHPHSGHVLPVPEHSPFGRLVQPRHQPHQRRLARQRRPEQHVHRALLQRQIGRMDMHAAPDDPAHAFQFQRHAAPPCAATLTPGTPAAPRRRSAM